MAQIRNCRWCLPLRILAGLLLMSCAVVVQADTPVVDIGHKDFSQRLVQQVGFIEDPSTRWTIQDVLLQPVSAYSYTNRDTLQFGYSESAYWLRIAIRNALPHSTTLTLQVRYPLLDFVDFYHLDQNNQVVHRKAGDHRPLQEREYPVKDYLHRLELAAGQQQTVYVRVQSTSSLSLPVYLSTETGLVALNTSTEWLDGGYYGIAFAMMMYNLLLMLVVRERIYLEYVICVVLQIGFIASLNGYAGILFPENLFLADKGIYFCSTAMAVAFIQFTRSFLQTRAELPRLDRFYRYYMWVPAVALLVEMLVSPTVAAKINVSLVMFTVLLLFPVALYRYLTGYQAASYFVFGQGMFLSSVIFTSLSSLNLVPFYFLAPLAIKVGSAAELMLFSMSLAGRINELKRRHFEMLREQEVAQAETKVSERHLQEMSQVNRQLEQAIQIRSKFLANMSHEIRTPMNGILGMLELIDKPGLDAVQRHYVDIARRSGRTLLDLINDVLDLSKIESGKLELEKKPFSLRELTEDLCSLYSQQVKNKHLTIKVVVDAAVPDYVIGDRTRLWQVLTNLISNAIKFTQRGGVVLRLDSVYADGQRIRFSVLDTGIGIAADQQEAVFDSFQQADGTTTREYGGTGLGLSISRKLVRLMDGDLALTSTPGQGSEFCFSLPCETASPEQIAELEDHDGDPIKVDLSSYRVLVVEDNEVNQKVAGGILRKLGVQTVDVVDNGLEALNFLREQTVDIVFMDVQMPVMDGYDATRQLRKIDALAQLPVVAMTANAMDGDRDECMAAGMNDYVSKPIKLDQVRQALVRNLVPAVNVEVDSAANS
ncbi:MAG: response regulator [Ketobacter sp.]|nr:response regulator [Ketobacter sp.]